jgi:predicted flap endonuclease-1-like 5' DNA nuclease
MATTKNKNKETSTLATIKTKAANINQIALKTSNEIVEETIATGEQWQNLLAKTLKKGTKLFGKQQDMVFSGLEMLKDQYSYGNKRLRKLLTFEPIKSKTPKTATNKPAATAKTSKDIDEVMDAATKAEKAVTTTAKKVIKPVAAKKATIAATPKKPAVAKEKKAIPTKTAKTINLTLIEGVGPKIQELLNNAGIVNFDQLAAASPADLKKILTDAGTRFQMHDPSTWAAQAKLAAAGKMEELKVLQAELKGGK